MRYFSSLWTCCVVTIGICCRTPVKLVDYTVKANSLFCLRYVMSVRVCTYGLSWSDRISIKIDQQHNRKRKHRRWFMQDYEQQRRRSERAEWNLPAKCMNNSEEPEFIMHRFCDWKTRFRETFNAWFSLLLCIVSYLITCMTFSTNLSEKNGISMWYTRCLQLYKITRCSYNNSLLFGFTIE